MTNTKHVEPNATQDVQGVGCVKRVDMPDGYYLQDEDKQGWTWYEDRVSLDNPLDNPNDYITWEAHKSMVTPSYTSLVKRTNILCPKCNKPLMKDASIALTTYPAQYRYFCEECGWTGTGF